MSLAKTTVLMAIRAPFAEVDVLLTVAERLLLNAYMVDGVDQGAATEIEVEIKRIGEVRKALNISRFALEVRILRGDS